MSNIDIILRALGADAVADSFSRISRSATEMGDEVERAANGAGQGLDEAGRRAANLDEKFENLRDAGAVITGVGAASLLLSANLRAVAEEGNAANARLEAVFAAQNRSGDLESTNIVIQDVTVRGHFDDDDGIRQSAVLLANWEVKTRDMSALLEAAGRQSQTTGQSVEQLANSFGKAVATGNYQGLKKSAVSFSETEIAAMDAAYAISQEAGQLALVNSISAAVARTTGELGSSLTEAQKAANDAARGMDDLKTTIGTGAAEAHTAILTGLVLPFLEVANAHPGLLKTAGGLLEIGGSVMSVGGPIIAFAGQIGMMRIGLAGMGTAGVAAFKSIMASVLTAAPAMWAAMAPFLPMMLAIVAAALLVAAAFYAVDKLTHAKEDKELRENIAAGEATDPARLENVNKDRKKHGKRDLTMEEFKAWENDTSGNWTDPTEKQQSDPENDLGSIESKMKALQAGNLGATPSLPISAPGALGAVAATSADSGVAIFSGADPDSFTSQIRQLEDQKRTASKAQKAAIDAQLVNLRRQQQDARKGKAASDKATREAARDAKAQKREMDALAKTENRGEISLQKIDLDNRYDAEIANLEDALDAAKDAKDAAKVESLTLQIELAKAQQKREEDLLDASIVEDKAQANYAIAEANLHYQGAVAAAQRAAKRAGRAVASSEGRDGKDKGDAAIRAMLALQNGTAGGMSYYKGFQTQSVSGFAPLNPSGSGSREGTARQTDVEQDSNGDYLVRFEPIRVPYQGLATMRGRIRR